MPLCSICRLREADQTGSHLLSAFLIESTVGARGEEQGYIMNEEPNFDYRNNTGAEPVIQDFLFCRGCEQRMAYIESYICSEYRDKIKTAKYQQNFQDIVVPDQPGLIREASRVNPYAFILLLLTLLFRLSLSTKLFAEFKLTAEEQERLRVIINEALPPYENFKVKIKQSRYLAGLNEKRGLFDGLYFIIATYDHLADETMGYNFVNLEFRLPYNIMLGQVIILFFFGKPRRGAVYLDYYHILENHDISTLINGDGTNIKTIIIPENNWMDILTRERDKIVRRKVIALQMEFTRNFIRDNGRTPTEQDWQTHFKEIYPDEA